MAEMYRSMGISYPKFFKMDLLSKAGFLAAEKVMSQAAADNELRKENMAVALVNSTSSTCDDREFQKGLETDNFFPSPSLFVYTLSNIVCGEIAIRHGIKGETSFYVQPSFSAEFLERAVEWAFQDPRMETVLCGWVECMTERPRCMMMLVAGESAGGTDFNEENIKEIFNITESNFYGRDNRHIEKADH